MTKLKITEAQIDSYNDTHDRLQRFEEGLNIICGNNEAGKSTLMEFIKNIITKKSSTAKGYIKCELGDEVFNLVAGDTKKLKENDKYNLKINPCGFKTGFVINLDDLMFANKATEDELINTIKDSSGNAINQKQDEYYNYIYNSTKYDFTLTPKNGVSNNLKKQFDELKNTDNRIKDLQSKEEDYNKLCTSLDSLDTEIEKLNKKIDFAELVLQKKTNLKDKSELQINQKIIANKSSFDKLREELGGLNSLRDKNIETEKDKETELCKLQQTELKEKYQLEIDNLPEIKLDDIKKSKSILEKELGYKLELAKKQLDETQTLINKSTFEVQSTENRLVELGIKDIEEYKTDKAMLSSYYTKYSDILNKAMSDNSQEQQSNENKWYNNMFMLIFGGILAASIGSLLLYWNSPARLILIIFILTSFVGLNTTFMQKIKSKELKNIGYKPELNKLGLEIIKLTNKLGMEIQKDVNFTVVIDSFLQKMNEKINDYKHIEEDLLKERINLEKLKSESENRNFDINKLETEIKELQTQKSNLLSELRLNSIDNIDEIYASLNDLKLHQTKLNELDTELRNLNNKTEAFVKSLNEFISEAGLEGFPSYNKYDIGKPINDAIDKISEILISNISLKTKLDEFDTKLLELENKLNSAELSDLEIDDDFSEENFRDLKTDLDTKINERGMLRQQKSDLEKVSGLIDVKNKRNLELNRLRTSLNNLIKHEVIYNVIQNSKEKFNEAQPNLVCAKEYFEKITGGKYSEIDFENKTVSGKTKGEKEWSKLSRGTKEQLYLAFRLGFANNYSKNIDGSPNGNPNLPIIIDDAFVNFDKERTASILKCLSEFSQHNQILYFTCHSDMIKEILDKEKIKYKEVEI